MDRNIRMDPDQGVRRIAGFPRLGIAVERCTEVPKEFSLFQTQIQAGVRSATNQNFIVRTTTHTD